jgi:hypothetical protein
MCRQERGDLGNKNKETLYAKVDPLRLTLIVGWGGWVIEFPMEE